MGKRQAVVVMHGTCGGAVHPGLVWGEVEPGAIGIVVIDRQETALIELDVQARQTPHGRSVWYYAKGKDFTRIGWL